METITGKVINIDDSRPVRKAIRELKGIVKAWDTGKNTNDPTDTGICSCNIDPEDLGLLKIIKNSAIHLLDKYMINESKETE